MQAHVQIAHDSLLIALRAQADLARSFQSDLLTTVYWSLGAVLVIAALLVGFGWFVNLRVYERDLGVLRREMQAAISTSIADALEKMRTELSDAISEATEELTDSSSSEIKRLSRELLRMQCQNLVREFEQRKEKENFGGAATTALRLLSPALELGWESYINTSLQGIVDSLAKGGTLMAGELREATKLLERVPGEYKVLRDRASAAVAQAETF